MHATGVAGEVTLELGDLLSHIAWCWLLSCVRREGQERDRDGSGDGGQDRRR